MVLKTLFCFKCIAFYNYSPVLWSFMAKSNISFSFQDKFQASYDYISDKKLLGIMHNKI